MTKPLNFPPFRILVGAKPSNVCVTHSPLSSTFGVTNHPALTAVRSEDCSLSSVNSSPVTVLWRAPR